MDLEPFLGERRPLPEAPQALFVGVLERYKNIDGLAEAWRDVAAPRCPGAQLRIVGDGSLRARRRGARRASVRWDRHLAPAEVAAALDAATVLVLPSRSEGMGRVLVEAFCRGRGVVATRVGGIRDLVEDGENGLLVEPGSTRALADALVRVLSDASLAARLGEGARGSRRRLDPDPGAVRRAGARARRRMKPRVLFVGRTRYELPLPAGLARKWDAIGERVDYRVLGCGEWGGGAGDERFELLPPVHPRRLDGAAFYALLPFRVRRSLRRTRPQAVFAREPADRSRGRDRPRAGRPAEAEARGRGSR